jgi:hypothetical protein
LEQDGRQVVREVFVCGSQTNVVQEDVELEIGA